MTQATASSRRPARYPSPWRDTGAAIDARLVRRLIAAQFPRYRELPVAAVVPGGHDNRTFRVGDSLCARLPSAGVREALRVIREITELTGGGGQR